MTDVLFFEKDGLTYAKGFITQEGFSVYVLPGYEETLREVLGATIGKYYLDVTGDLPGGSRCPPEAP